MNLSRRNILIGGASGVLAAVGSEARTQQGDQGMDAMPTPEQMQVAQRSGLYANLHDPHIGELPLDAFEQRFTFSPAPKADPSGAWLEAPPLPVPRSEMAWAAVENDRLHVIGGYANQQVAVTYHQVFDARTGQWQQAAPVPRGANHIGVTADVGVIYAFGGFVEQNQIAVPDCYAYIVADDRWHATRPLSRGSRSAISVVALNGLIHAVGGRDVRSVDWHEAYEPKSDTWHTLAPVPGPRDHTAAVIVDGLISVVGGRMDTFDFNTGMHVVYDAKADNWQERAPMPTPRSGHGGVFYNGKLFCMGGEGTRRVFGELEAYDPRADSWQAYALMPTKRHGMGAGILSDGIHVAGGGPMNGGAFQTSVHEVFKL